MRALVFSIDDAYVMPFKVLWHSMMKTESIPDEVPVFILHAETLSPHSIRNVSEFLKKYGRAAAFKDTRSFVPDDILLSHHISKASYYRLFAASTLPEEITSMVYLDIDAVVIRSIRELFDLKLTRPLAAADHMIPRAAFRLWGDLGGNYFQAGVLLADLGHWRTNQLEDKFKKILAEERDRIIWWDQDVLNIAFENNWQRLPVWYNLSGHARKEITEVASRENGRFLHYTGISKPWNSFSKDWLAEHWYALYLETFGKKFDTKSIQHPIWKRFLSASKRILKLVLGPT
jgi:lipopolysaccharide biosynthesis glycosyltransferase